MMQHVHVITNCDWVRVELERNVRKGKEYDENVCSERRKKTGIKMIYEMDE
jgi:hypothetical protein